MATLIPWRSTSMISSLVRSAIKQGRPSLQVLPGRFCSVKTEKPSTLAPTIREPTDIEVQKNHSEFGQYIAACLPKYVQKIQISCGDELEILVAPDGIYPVLMFLKNHHNTLFEGLMDITAIDVPSRVYRFEIIYNLLSVFYNSRIRVKTYTMTPIDSVFSIYPGADWFEREVWDMYGVFFTNHPDLRRILTDYGFRGHPLRKDFPLAGFTQCRWDSSERRIVYEPVEFAQEYRQFDLNAPWEQFPNFRQKDTEEVAEEPPKVIEDK